MPVGVRGPFMSGGGIMLVSVLGLAVFVAFVWAAGYGRGPTNWRVLFWGVGLQIVFGVLVFRTGIGHSVLLAVNDAVNAVLTAAWAGPMFLVGALADVGATTKAGLGFLLFFQGLLSIVVISAMLQLLYHFGIMGWVVKLFARAFSRLMRVSGAESLAASANILVGNESILSVRPFLATMTRSELCVLMTACMATISANVMGAYVAMLRDVFPGIAGHLASASLLSAPAALLAAKLIWPETERPETLGRNVEPYIERSPNTVAAVMSGAEAGGKLLVGISLLLVAVVGLLGILDVGIGWAGGGVNALFGWSGEWTAAGLLGFVFQPAAWLMGIPWAETKAVGDLLGMRVVMTEVGSYGRLAAMMADGSISPRSAVIAAYALCGFAHIPAVAITAGGVAALVPSRRDELSVIAPRAFVAATVACLMTGCIAGIFAGDAPVLLLGGS